MHTNDMLKPLGGLHTPGWGVEGGGCILEGGSENIGVSDTVAAWKCRGLQKVQGGRKSGQIVLGKGLLGGGAM
eukprot:1195979-Prorocentrum_minimum.AAC.7